MRTVIIQIQRTSRGSSNFLLWSLSSGIEQENFQQETLILQPTQFTLRITFEQHHVPPPIDLQGLNFILNKSSYSPKFPSQGKPKEIPSLTTGQHEKFSYVGFNYSSLFSHKASCVEKLFLLSLSLYYCSSLGLWNFRIFLLAHLFSKYFPSSAKW